MANKIEFRVLGDVKDIEQKLGSVGTKFTKLGKQMTTFVSLPLALVSGGLIKAASDAEETQNKFDVVFREINKSANKWATEFGRDVGRSSSEIKRFSSGLGDVLKPLGFTTEEAFKLSAGMTQLALDVASFNNRQDADVIRAFTSALTGERESLKTLGIVINEADVKQEAMRLGLVRVGEELSKTAKAQATYSLLLKNTEDAQGDLARTQDSFANQLKRFQAEVTNLSEAFGNLLLPAATEFISKATTLLVKITELDSGSKTLILTLGGILAVIGPVLLIVGGLSSGLGGVAKFALFASDKVIILGNSIFTLATALKAVAGVGAAAFIGWNVGRTIAEVLQLDEGLQLVFKRLFDIKRLNNEQEFGDIQAARLAASGITQNDVNAFARKQLEKQTALQQEEQMQAEHEEKMRAIQQETFDFISSLEEEKNQSDIISSQNKYQKFLSDLEIKRQALFEDGLLTVEIEKSIQEQITEIKKKEAEAQTKILQKKLGLEDKLRAREVESIDKSLAQIASINKDFGRVAQGINIGFAIINTARGVTEELKKGIVGIPTAAIIAAQGAIEIATIASQSFAVGTPDIPRDMMATVHKGEMIIPASFSSAIRSGELSLSGGNRGGSEEGGGGGIMFNFDGATFVGVTESVVEEIFTKASEQIENGTLAFRGAS